MRDATVCSQSARGFTLVEVLVALVVLSVGLLGIAGLQLTSLKANHGSATRTQAVYLAYDIIDRMRANPTAALNHDYDIALGDTASGGTVAGDDKVAWRQNIARFLPAGSIEPTGSVALDAATNMLTVIIQWDDSHANVASQPDVPTGAPPRVPDVVSFSVTTQLSN